MAALSLAGIVPAQLGFLAIFNPSLGTTDETLDDQIVYYASVSAQAAGRRGRHYRSRPTESVSQEERNERLRQIGLAQGMVEFGKSFSGECPVDTIETEKSRVVLHELEPGWWILASINLTILPTSAGTPSRGHPEAAGGGGVEYSAREVKPSALLLQDLLRAHSLFLLHHDSSLSALFVRSKRPKFSSMLGRYWDLFLSTWNVLLHGNPIRDIFGGIKVAASGELGVGVGEEDRGSGEREVLEGLVGRIEGLVDLVVSKFGSSESDPWLGAGNEPGAEDGAIFLGVGALSRNSLRDITHWMEDLYTWGECAYGVQDSPTSTRSARRPKKQSAAEEAVFQPPPPIVPVGGRRETQSPTAPPAKAAGESKTKKDTKSTPTPSPAPSSPAPEAKDTESGGMDKVVHYLKMGYGTYWTIGGSSPVEGGEAGHNKEASLRTANSSKSGDDTGRYLIGLMGDVEGPSVTPDDRSAGDSDEEYNSRTLLRTVVVECEGLDRPECRMTKDLGSHDRELSQGGEDDGGRTREQQPSTAFNSQDRNKSKKFRVVVYVTRPFIFTFLFQLRTDSLAFDGLYKSLHHQLAPLRRPLATSTAYRPGHPDAGSASAQIYDLVWDCKALTTHSTIPNIPEPGTGTSPGPGSQVPWSRVEALNTHTQLLNTYAAKREDPSELERTCKTSRGWWVVWSRILEQQAPPRDDRLSEEGGGGAREHEGATGTDGEGLSPDDDGANDKSQKTATSGGMPTPSGRYTISKEIFLLRKAGESSSASSSGAGNVFQHVRSVSGASPSSSSTAAPAAGAGGGEGRGLGWADGASRLAQGIGVDTRKYIEGLLSLNR